MNEKLASGKESILAGTFSAGRTVHRLEEPAATETDPKRVVEISLDWHRDRVLSKLVDLTEEQLRYRGDPPTWSPLELIQHLTWVERRWMRWGFAAEQVAPYPDGDNEWLIPENTRAEQVIAEYRAELATSRQLAATAEFHTPSATGGRFEWSDEATPTLGRLLVHLLQEYARHVGQLDIVRELIDGATGE